MKRVPSGTKERTGSSPIFSVAPPGLWPFSTRNPRLKPVETVGYFRSSLSGLWDPCSSVVQREVHHRVQPPPGHRTHHAGRVRWPQGTD